MSEVIVLRPDGNHPRPEGVRISTAMRRAYLKGLWLQTITFNIPRKPGHYLAGLPDLWWLPNEVIADPIADSPRRLGGVLGVAAGKVLMAHWEQGGDSRFHECYQAIEEWLQPTLIEFGGEVFEGAKEAIHDLAEALQTTPEGIARVCHAFRQVTNGTLTIAALNAVHGYRCIDLQGVLHG